MVVTPSTSAIMRVNRCSVLALTLVKRALIVYSQGVPAPMGLSRMSSSQDQSLHAFDAELGAHGGQQYDNCRQCAQSICVYLEGARQRGLL